MLCFGLAAAACSRLLAAFRETEKALLLIARYGLFGSIIPLALTLMQSLGNALVGALRARAQMPSGFRPGSRENEGPTDLEPS